MAVVEREREQLHGILDEVERLDALAQAIQAGRKSEAHQAVEELRLLRIRDARPVRLALAAELLAVSVPTVKAWADEGVLEWRDGSPQRVSLGSVLHVGSIVRELKQLGRNRDLLAAVLARLEDEATLSDRRLQTSLDEMRQGRKVYRRRRAA